MSKTTSTISTPVILWLSRHPMNAEQEMYWKSINPECQIITENVTWANSRDDMADWRANSETWTRLVEQYKPVVFAGVFPAVALEAVNHKIPMYSSISEQNSIERQDGTKQIVFIHVRWSRDLNPYNQPRIK